MKVRVLLQVLPAAALLALTGCASSQPSAREDTTTAQQAVKAPDTMCPTQVPGTKVEASSTEQGAALTFTTTGDVAELRKRVAAMAEMHNTHHAGAKARSCEHGEKGAEASCPKCAQGQECTKESCPKESCPKESCPKRAQGQECTKESCPKESCPKHAQEQQGESCPKGAKHGKRAGAMKAPASRATVEEIEGGARLVLTPEDPAQADALRAHVQRRAEMLSSGMCPRAQAHSEAH
jgi:hypothetical protein